MFERFLIPGMPFEEYHIESENLNLLEAAARYGAVVIMAKLLEKGHPLGLPAYPALLIAAWNKRWMCVRLLIEAVHEGNKVFVSTVIYERIKHLSDDQEDCEIVRGIIKSLYTD